MNTQTVQIESVEEIMAAVKAAKAAVEKGEQKARQAKALLAQAQHLEQELELCQRQAEQEVATAQNALAEAEGLRAVLGDDFVAKASALVDQLESKWAARVREAADRLEEAKNELRTLDEDPELEAFLTLTEHEQREKAARRAARRQEFTRKLDTLRSGAAIGEGGEALLLLAKDAASNGFEDLAAKARQAAERATRVRLAREEEVAARLQQAFIRWCSDHTAGGRIVLVLSWDERQAAQLHPRPAASGRLYFEVMDTTGTADVPEKYDDVPANSRTWKARNWDEPEGFTLDQIRFLHALASGIRGREANALNAALAKKVESEKKSKAKSDAEVKTEAEAARGPEASKAGAETTVDLPGLPAGAVNRLHKVGLTTRQAIEEAASDKTSFLALPGIGQATLNAVQGWLAADDDSEDEIAAEEPEVEAAKTEDAADVDPEIIVAGISMNDDMPGIRLAEWQGAANVLTPLLRAGRIGRLDLLIEETHNGKGPEVGILASWNEGGKTVEITVPGNGSRNCRLQAMQQLVGALRA